MESKVIQKGRRKKCSSEHLNQFINNEIKIIGGINAGSFGDIYLGRDVHTMEEFAIKIDKKKTERSLQNFFKEYRIMKKIEGTGIFPKCSLVNFTPNNSNDSNIELSAMIMEKLGPNIYDMFKICGRELSIKTGLWLIQDFISRIKEFHASGLVHRDIKPENFCLGGEDLKDVYLIDFGLSKPYLDSKGEHVPFEKNRGFVGTRRYASKYAHKGYLQSRRDDLEAIGYLTIFLIKGSLPWQDIKTRTKTKKEKHQKLFEMKSKMSLKNLCVDLPPPFERYMRCIKDLEYLQIPEYDYYIKIFLNFCKENEIDRKFEWEENYEFNKELKGWKKYQDRMKEAKKNSEN